MTDVKDADAVAHAALAAGRPALVARRRIADCDTPVAAALKLMEPGRGDFLLESVEGGSQRGRYSMVGLAPDLVFRARGDTAEINRRWATDRDAFVPSKDGALLAMRNLVAECRMDVPADMPPALACLVGYFAYETIRLVERLPRPVDTAIDVPDMLFVRPTLVLVFDRLTDELHIVAPLWPDPARDPADQIAAAVEQIDATFARLAAPTPARTVIAGDAAEPVVTPVMPAGRYGEMVARAKDYIAAGDIFQVVLAQRFTMDFPLPPLDLYRALRRINPSPFLYYLDLPGFAIIGSSPEILVRARDGEVTIRPIAGTRPRGKTAAEDAANRAELLTDPKERAEHLMLLDLGRNDVGRVAQAGTVTVTDSYGVEFYSHVMHIVSNVVGKIAPGVGPLDALFAGFPAGTVSGAPKVRACQVIAELETESRGPYGGGVGYFAPDGGMDSCIVLRTAVLKDGVMHVQAGAGIVADSDPAAEQRECEAKSGALFAAAREAIRLASTSDYGQ
ncbi:anthranilate synthase component I [Sphingomonas prati]|uniref:Anthranilate synthase component 1 n=1 Tax=Sphingomonas prati TaxID=1843237 RepID=A0A7W9F3L3_9SPHN|nr:anthranilate synthase component I [Sphingomonas prati]MBB5729635.1 anthranilate synthase component 1 [Sphingomonas prati]GGE75944.1 anthranilate synthase component I [Sphingomonas prati]